MPTFLSDRENLAITLGDPSGVGPEVTIKALHSWHTKKKAKLLLLGGAQYFNALAKRLRIHIKFQDIQKLSEWGEDLSFIPCFGFETMPRQLKLGKYDSGCASLAVRSITLAATLAMEKKVDAVVTAPINKASLMRAGFDFLGHTELLAKLSGSKRYEMMLVGGPLKVVLVTRHLAFKDVPRNISRSRVEECILLTHRELQASFGIRSPRLGVCGLNPHAGEEGNFGNEEIRTIAPAVKAAQKKTFTKIIGPLPPDILFRNAYLGRYDAEICMYHDQGLIPLKMISRGSGVNVTLGLPFVRTSPDHGTGYDIAAKFSADPGSMIESLNLAVTLSKNRKANA